MNELAGQSLGGYQLEEEVGHGSMGVVYRGKQIALGREVAIKVLPKALARDLSYVARFIREAQIIAGLNHPNIVQIYDAGQQNKLLYFVMEYIQGPTLASLLHLDGTIPFHLAVEYSAQIADALDAAYRERHVIHRDIKPENLMLNRWGKIKVMDFGLARAIGHQKITVARTLVGSIYYASPEQIWGEDVDNRSDVYALGVVLYEMVTGQRPFTGRSMPELTQAIVQGNPPPPSVYNAALPHDIERIIMQALSLHREQRYANASLMAEQLRALNLKADLPPAALPNTPIPGVPLSTQFPNRPHRAAMQPPKRPNTQRPNYLVDMELTQPPAAELPKTPRQPVHEKPHTVPQQPVHEKPHTVPQQPVHEKPHTTRREEKGEGQAEEAVHEQKTQPYHNTPIPSDEVKTAALEVFQRPQGKDSIWSWLRKLLQSSR